MHGHQAGHSRALRIAGVATALSGLLLMVGGAAQVASADPSPHGNATGNKFVPLSGSGDTSSGGTSGAVGTSSSGATSGGVTTGGTSSSGSTSSGVTTGGDTTSSTVSSGVASGLLILSANTNNGNNPHDTTTTTPSSTTTPGSTTTLGGAKGIPNPDFVADAPSTDQFVTVTTENCNGIIPTPGSKKERKTLNTALASTFSGKAVIHWSVFPYQHPNGSADTLTVHDCVVAYPAGYLVPGTDFNATTGELLTLDPSILKKNYTVLDKAELLDVTLTSHPGSNDTFDYAWTSPTSLPAGTVVCNYAKTTGNNSSGDTNRKGGGACIVVPGESHTTTTVVTVPPGIVVTPTSTTTTVTVPPTVAVLPEVITTTTVPTAVLPEVLTRTLPFTGTNSQFPLFAGMALVMVGLVLVGAARRRDSVLPE